MFVTLDIKHYDKGFAFDNTKSMSEFLTIYAVPLKKREVFFICEFPLESVTFMEKDADVIVHDSITGFGLCKVKNKITPASIGDSSFLNIKSSIYEVTYEYDKADYDESGKILSYFGVSSTMIKYFLKHRQFRVPGFKLLLNTIIHSEYGDIGNKLLFVNNVPVESDGYINLRDFYSEYDPTLPDMYEKASDILVGDEFTVETDTGIYTLYGLEPLFPLFRDYVYRIGHLWARRILSPATPRKKALYSLYGYRMYLAIYNVTSSKYIHLLKKYIVDINGEPVTDDIKEVKYVTCTSLNQETYRYLAMA